VLFLLIGSWCCIGLLSKTSLLGKYLP